MGEPCEGLEQFVMRVGTLEEVNDFGATGFDLEFALLREYQNEVKAKTTRRAGTDARNVRKNRYRDIIPYDHSRVQLHSIPPTEEGQVFDYINASHIPAFGTGVPSLIAAQGPLPHTTDDFWRMVWETNAQIIVMACNVIEKDRFKCAKYWPDLDEVDDFGDFSLKTVSDTQISPDYSLRTIEVTFGKEERTVYNFHYQTWPDHGVPETTSSVVELLNHVRQIQPGRDRPIIIHCSAGCGRTGTLCAIDECLLQVEEHGTRVSMFDVNGIVQHLRDQRIAMVQTNAQYIFVYQALLDVARALLDAAAAEDQEQDSAVAVAAATQPAVIVPPKEKMYVNFQRKAAHTMSKEQRQRAHTVVQNSNKRIRPAMPRPATSASADVDEDGIVDDQDTSTSKAQPSVESRDGPLGFPNRIAKPKGPRPIPQSWKLYPRNY
eukprot:m.18408 g.18408  ORF g.18408 m.18408 type:complete len:434 (+) comp7822_c0_seq1:289-1590(+)